MYEFVTGPLAWLSFAIFFIGVIVRTVTPGSPAEAMKLKAGDLIVDTTSVSVPEVVAAIRKDLQEELKHIYDMERLLARVTTGRASRET